jgi:hypothetical protein
MGVYFLPHGSPAGAFASVRAHPLAGGERRPAGDLPPCVGDLGHDDHLVAFMSSRLVTARLSGVRCRVSAWLREPPTVQGRFYRLMPLIAGRFHRVLTHSRALVGRVPTARFVPHGGCWLRDRVDPGGPRSRRVSMIASARRSAPGHLLRHRIAAWSREQCPDLELLGRGYLPLDDKADGHAPYMYSVVIENSREPGYFTEKIIDSLMCGSVPIYWGAPDIGSYFDVRGIIQCASEADLRDAIIAATEGRRAPMTEAIAANRVRADHFADFRSIAAAVLESDRSYEVPWP